MIGYRIVKRVDSNHIERKYVVPVYILLERSRLKIFFWRGIRRTWPMDMLMNWSVATKLMTPIQFWMFWLFYATIAWASLGGVNGVGISSWEPPTPPKTELRMNELNSAIMISAIVPIGLFKDTFVFRARSIFHSLHLEILFVLFNLRMFWLRFSLTYSSYPLPGC